MRYKKFISLLSIVLTLSQLVNNAQSQSVGNYSVSRTTGNIYTSIASSGSSLPGWRYTGNFSEDDNRSIATDIGFDFWYNGTRYTQFSVSTNGFLDFSSSTDDGGPQCDAYGYCNYRFTDRNVNNATWLALAPFYDDMTTGGGVDPLGTSIKYQLSGTAPNRVLTVEWINMAVYQNTSPDINFQVKLYESSGVIEYWYGTMISGTHSFSYTVGINAASVSRNPLVSELLTQQTANTATFNNSPQNNLSAMPVANSKISFTPPVPASPTGNLTFTGITNTGMTLNWSDWAVNEVGYAIYYSEDNVNFYYNTLVPANSTSATITGLAANTTYYWRIHAATEGQLSTALTGTATTLAPGTVTSVGSGRWDRPNTWDCNCIPSIADNVLVNHIVDIRSISSANDITINSGGTLQFVFNSPATLTVNGNVLVNSGGSFQVEISSTTTHQVNLRGNIINNGTVNLNPDADSFADVYFTGKLGDQSISGNSVVNNYNLLFIDKGSETNVLEIFSNSFSCDVDALNFVSGGTFKFSSPGANNISLFGLTRSIPADCRVEMNSATSTLNFTGGVDLQGSLVLTTGTINIGNLADQNLTVNGGSISIDGGELNIAGRLDRTTSENTINYSQTDGIMTLPTAGSTSATLAPFMMDVIGSTFNMSGGTIVIQRAGGTGGQNLGFISSGATQGTITGGKLQIGNAQTPLAQVIGIETGTPISLFEVNSTNVTASITGADLNVLSDIVLTSGTLVDNGNNISLAGNWINSGAVYAGSSSVQFTGPNQSITSGSGSFGNVEIAGTGTKTLLDNLMVTGDIIISSSLGLNTPALQINIGGNWQNDGTFNRNDETLLLNGSITQSIGGSSPNSFTKISVNKSGGGVSVDTDLDLYGTLAINSATAFDLDGAGTSVFRLVSNATDDARIAELPAGATLSGNVIFEKYFSGIGSKYWRHIGTPVSGSTVADLQNEIPVSGSFTGNDNGTNGIPVSAFPSLYRYNASLPGLTLDDRWEAYPIAGNNEVLSTVGNEATGYAIWMRDTGPVTFDLTGSINSGDIDYNLNGSNEGWNLLGNPYPSDIDWNNPGWTKNQIQGNTIYVWNGVQYLFWNGSFGSLTNGRIAKGQGFWVQAGGATPSLISTETVKTATQTATYRTLPGKNTEQFIELTLSGGGYSDKSYIQLTSWASDSLDSYDAGKLNNPIFNLSTLSKDSVSLSINASGMSYCERQIPIIISNTWKDNYSLGIEVKDALRDVYEFKIADNHTGTVYAANDQHNKIDFVISDDPATSDPSRFSLIISPKPLSETLELTVQQSCEQNSQVSLTIGDTQLHAEYEIVVNGKTDSVFIGTGEAINYILTTSMSPGENELTVRSFGLGCHSVNTTFAKSFNFVRPPAIEYDSDKNMLYSIDGQKGLWFHDNELISTVPASSIQANTINGGAYVLEVTNEICSYRSDEFLVTSLNELNLANDLRVSPNPANHYIEVNFDNIIEYLIITDVKGRQFYKSFTGERMLNISHLDNGLYVLTVFYEGEHYSKRFIKR